MRHRPCQRRRGGVGGMAPPVGGAGGRPAGDNHRPVGLLGWLIRPLGVATVWERHLPLSRQKRAAAARPLPSLPPSLPSCASPPAPATRPAPTPPVGSTASGRRDWSSPPPPPPQRWRTSPALPPQLKPHSWSGTGWISNISTIMRISKRPGVQVISVTLVGDYQNTWASRCSSIATMSPTPTPSAPGAASGHSSSFSRRRVTDVSMGTVRAGYPPPWSRTVKTGPLPTILQNSLRQRVRLEEGWG